MFGYVTINKTDLPRSEYELYQSYYCGICHSLKELHGLKGRMALSYDMVFLALLLTDLNDTEVEPEKMFCPLHPTRKCGKAMNQQTAYAADMTAILAYFQCLDHWQDNGNRWYRRAAKQLQPHAEEAGKRWPRQYQAVEKAVHDLAEAEKRGETDIDLVASFTGEMLSEVFVEKEAHWDEDLRAMGFYLGKFIYLMDAYEDLEKDRKKGNYNVFLSMSKEADFEDRCKALLTEMMAGCAYHFERLPVLEYSGLLRNIIYSGVWNKYYMVYNRRMKKDADKEK